MAFVNFYLDKPFNPAVEKEKIKQTIAGCNKKNKPYPAGILNTKPTTLYLFFTYGKGGRLKINTNNKVLPSLWDFRKGKYKNSIKGSLELNNELDTLAGNVLKQYSRLKDEKEILGEADIVNMLSQVVNGHVKTGKNKLEKAKVDFLFQKKKVLKEGTLKEYRTIFKSLTDMEKKEKDPLDFSSFNQAFYNRYEQFLLGKSNPYKEEQGLLNDTIAKYCATLKSFLQWCHENGYHQNPAAYSKIKTQIKRKTKNEIVTLTEAEVFQLMDKDLSDNLSLERVRDLFCFGCFTGQRFSDIMRFNKDDFDGKKWDFISMKTKKRVVVPMTGFVKHALPILKKYNYSLPVISNQKFNEYLKKIGKAAEINTPVHIVRYSGINEIQMRHPKHEFMASHMARRTFVTIMLEKGVPITVVQKITQHADIRTLLKYEGHTENALFESLKNT
jgi:integrase